MYIQSDDVYTFLTMTRVHTCSTCNTVGASLPSVSRELAGWCIVIYYDMETYLKGTVQLPGYSHLL
jgi:hypothetical protein